MEEWILNTTLPFYRLIERGEKTYDTRAPDPSNPKKKYDEVKKGDIVLIMPSTPQTFEPLLHLPTLRYEVSDVQHFPPRENENWESVAERALIQIGIEKIFPRHSLEEALATYRSFPNYPDRIKKYGITALGLGERLG